MKRVKDLFPSLISDENIVKAIEEVNRTHRSRKGRLNKTVIWVEATLPDRIKELRQIILDGYEQSPAIKRRRYDHSAGKWRVIAEPKLYPDQYIHHMVIQVLQPVMMRGMDFWCCGSIRGRGTSRGMRGIKNWMHKDTKYTKYAAELDIYHFYDSIQPEVVMDRMRELIKDEKMLDVIYSLVKDGIMIGAYFSQWFANTLLQPMDNMIRQQLHIKHYVRYMDNITIFSNNKKLLHKAVRAINAWLNGVHLRLKDNWQVYRTKSRMVTGLGYRYSKDKVLLRKKNLLKIKRSISNLRSRLSQNRSISFKQASGLISRIGMLNHCECRNIRRRLLQSNLIYSLKNIIKNSSSAEHRRKLNNLITGGGQFC